MIFSPAMRGNRKLIGQREGCFALKKSGMFFRNKKEAVRKSGQLTNTSSFASGERRLKSKKKSRLAGIKICVWPE